MVLYLGGLIIGMIFASVDLGGLFSGGLIFFVGVGGGGGGLIIGILRVF